MRLLQVIQPGEHDSHGARTCLAFFLMAPEILFGEERLAAYLTLYTESSICSSVCIESLAPLLEFFTAAPCNKKYHVFDFHRCFLFKYPYIKMNIALNKRHWDVPALKGGDVPEKLDASKMTWKGKTLFYDGREVVTDTKRQGEILAELYEGVDTPFGMNQL